MKTDGAWRSRHPAVANALAAAIAASLIGIGVCGVLGDDFVVPLTRGYHHRHLHFHGAAAELICAGLVFGGASILIVIWRRLRGRPDTNVGWGRPKYWRWRAHSSS